MNDISDVARPPLGGCTPIWVYPLTALSLLCFTSSSALALSWIECDQSTQTAYVGGVPFEIPVVTVDGHPAEKDTANAYYLMSQAAHVDGVTLQVKSAFRTHAEQEALYECYVECDCNDCALEPEPGHSRYQSGHALELNVEDWSSPVYTWLVANAASFGFLATVPSEPWVWEWWGGGIGGGPCQTCVPHCAAGNLIQADCSELSCESEGTVCVHPLGAQPRCATGCTPACEGGLMILADCSIGDCAAQGAECVMEGDVPSCKIPIAPYCAGTQLVGASWEITECAQGASGWCNYESGSAACDSGCKARCDGDGFISEDCSTGGCGAFGLTCVINSFDVGPVCETTPPCEHTCQGTQIVMNDCSVVDCGVFGSTCLDFGLGPECLPPNCEPSCSGSIAITSGCEEINCGEMGKVCALTGVGENSCVSESCVAETGELQVSKELCYGGKRYACDAVGVAVTLTTPIEICNGLDDDCDGQVDEGTLNACGTCGLAPLEKCNALDDDCDGVVDEGVVEVELCNGMDDDCDGTVDENYDVGAACSVGLGACLSQGMKVCAVDALSTACDAALLSGSDELCNGIDDNCDGEVDEGVKNSCGGCGEVGDEVCDGVDNNCDGMVDEGLLNACDTCGALPKEVCNGVDDDCNGEIDEGFGLGQVCVLGQGACEVQGTVTCTADGKGDVCTGTLGQPTVEECGDGIDNDCDGVTDSDCAAAPEVEVEPDDDPPDPPECTLETLQPCVVEGLPPECNAGTQMCLVDGMWGACVPDEDCELDDGGDEGEVPVEPGAEPEPEPEPEGPCPPGRDPVVEVCNDLDDDCDGEVDEDDVCETCKPAAIGACSLRYRSGVCAEGERVCGEDGTWGPCLATPACQLPDFVPGLEEKWVVEADVDGEPDDDVSESPDGGGCMSSPAGGMAGGLWWLYSLVCVAWRRR